jgi:hypothetical protein
LQFHQFHSGAIEFFPALALGLVDEGESGVHRIEKERRKKKEEGRCVYILAENMENG